MGLVLVVEDDTSTMFVICSLVQRTGHIPLRARNGRVAWEFLEDNYDSIDLVITDLMMPEMDGHELIEKVREDMRTAKIPIIVQSAYLGVKGTRELMEQGADAVIPKPIDGKYLMDHIARHIAISNRNKQKAANTDTQTLA